MEHNQPLPLRASGFLQTRRILFRGSVRCLNLRFLLRWFRRFGFQYGSSSGRRVLKDMLFILFGFSAGIFGPRSGSDSRMRLKCMCVLTGPNTTARCGTSLRDMTFLVPAVDHLGVIPALGRVGSRSPSNFRSSFACHERPLRHLERSSPA